MVPFWCRECQLGTRYAILGQLALEVLPLLDVCTACVLDLVNAYDARYDAVPFLHKCGYIGHVWTKHVNPRTVDLLKAIEVWEECTPEHCKRLQPPLHLGTS